MSSSVVFAGFVEVVLILVTILLLIQPKALFRAVPSRIQAMAKWGGLLLLCLTFCWSIVFGIILSVNNLTLQI